MDKERIDKRELANRFTEISARFIDMRDQQHEGVLPPYDHRRWKVRYRGMSELPENMIEMNTFKPLVDLAVSQLMLALDDEDWARANQPEFKDQP